MTTTVQLIREHYSKTEDDSTLLTNVTKLLESFGTGPVTAASLAGLDQFHIRGLAATVELAKLAAIQPSAKVLDAGSGLGGPARYLAEHYGCSVIGLDLTPAYVAVAQLLAEKTNLAHVVTYQAGDLTALPFPDGHFDLVWTQHVVMNIADRPRAYREFRRVLKPGGKVAFYDLVAADDKPPLEFPAPWAATSETSFLLNKAETIAAFQQGQLKLNTWHDVTAEALSWFQQQTPPSSPPPLAIVLGPRVSEMLKNLVRNIREGKAYLVMGICDAA